MCVHYKRTFTDSDTICFCYWLVFAVQIPIKAPDSARGELEITYVDEELR